jgi:hypothetical protein
MRKVITTNGEGVLANAAHPSITSPCPRINAGCCSETKEVTTSDACQVWRVLLSWLDERYLFDSSLYSLAFALVLFGRANSLMMMSALPLLYQSHDLSLERHDCFTFSLLLRSLHLAPWHARWNVTHVTHIASIECASCLLAVPHAPVSLLFIAVATIPAIAEPRVNFAWVAKSQRMRMHGASLSTWASSCGGSRLHPTRRNNVGGTLLAEIELN